GRRGVCAARGPRGGRRGRGRRRRRGGSARRGGGIAELRTGGQYGPKRRAAFFGGRRDPGPGQGSADCAGRAGWSGAAAAVEWSTGGQEPGTRSSVGRATDF